MYAHYSFPVSSRLTPVVPLSTLVVHDTSDHSVVLTPTLNLVAPDVPASSMRRMLMRVINKEFAGPMKAEGRESFANKTSRAQLHSIYRSQSQSQVAAQNLPHVIISYACHYSGILISRSDSCTSDCCPSKLLYLIRTFGLTDVAWSKSCFTRHLNLLSSISNSMVVEKFGS